MEGLEVKPSAIHGLGVFAGRNFRARRKIGELDGEIVPIAEARRRARDAKVIAIVEFEDGKALDATGDRCLRYVNHSCAPNTFMRRHRHRVEFYALRRIRTGEELTCDYGETHHEGKLPCRCGAENCAGKI